MKKPLVLIAALLLTPFLQALACSTCFGQYGDPGNPAPGSIQNMAMAIWVMMFILMSVLAGLGMFSLHLWRHSRLPMQPHEELAEEDLSDYA